MSAPRLARRLAGAGSATVMLITGLVGVGFTSAAPAAAKPVGGQSSTAVGDGEYGVLAACGDTQDVTLRRGIFVAGEAHWTVGCSNNNVTITGWAKDRRADGLCVQVYALIGTTWHYGPKACPSGIVKEFELNGSGRPIEVYARLIG